MAGAAGVVIALAGAAYSAYSQNKAGQESKDIANQNAAAARAAASENSALANQTALDNIEIARQNRAIADSEAASIEDKGRVNVAFKRKEIEQLLAYQRTQEAVTGFKYEGTPEYVAAQSATEGEQDVAMIWANAVTEADAMRAKGKVISTQGERSAGQIIAQSDVNAENMNTQADIMTRQGSYAADAGKTGAYSTLLSGLSNAYTAYKYPTLITQKMKIG
jgi:hypothetical protein